MAVSRMVLPAPRRSLPLKLGAVLIAAAAVLLAQVMVHQLPGAHPAVRSSAAGAAAGVSQPGTAGSTTGSLRAAPALPALPAATAAPAAMAAPAASGFRAANAAPAAGAGSGSRPIVTLAPPSNDGIDGGGGRIASGGPGQTICSVQKNCK